MAIEDHLIDPFFLELDRRAAPTSNVSQPQAAGASSSTGLPSAAGDNTSTVSGIAHQPFGINNASGFTGTSQPFDVSLASGLVIGAQPLATGNSDSIAIATAGKLSLPF